MNPTFHTVIPPRVLPTICETVALSLGFMTERVID